MSTIIHRYLSAKESTMKSYLQSVGGTIRFRKDLTPEPLSNGKNFFSFFCCPFSQFGKRKIPYLKIDDLSVKKFQYQEKTSQFVFKNACVLTIMNALYPVFVKKTGGFKDSPLRALLKNRSSIDIKAANIDELKELFLMSAIEFIRANYTAMRIDGQSFPITANGQVSYKVGHALEKQIAPWFDTLYKQYRGEVVTLIFEQAYQASIEYYYAGDPEHKRPAPVLTILPVDRYASITKLRNDDPILKVVHDKWLAGEMTQDECLEYINERTGNQITLITLKRKFKNLGGGRRLSDDDPVLIEVLSKLNSGVMTYAEALNLIESKTGKHITSRTLYNKRKKFQSNQN